MSVEAAWSAKRRHGAIACDNCIAAAADRLAQHRRDQIEQLMERQGVGKAYRDCQVGQFPAELQEVAARLFAEGEFPGLLITGDSGTHKTRFACALMREWILAGRTVSFTTARAVFREVRETYAEDSKLTESALLDRRIAVDLFVVDDLGREGRITDQVLSVLHEFIDERLRNNRPTVITTNLDVDGIEAVYGANIASRLHMFEWLVMDGPDGRRQPREA